MTIEDLWQEYREKCCPPELYESSEEVNLQRMVFFAAVTATIGSIIQRQACFRELQESIVDWIETTQAEAN